MAVEFTAENQEVSFVTDFALTGGYTMSVFQYADTYGFGDNDALGKAVFTIADSSDNGAVISYTKSVSKMVFFCDHIG